jgi:hypothetical protein
MSHAGWRVSLLYKIVHHPARIVNDPDQSVGISGRTVNHPAIL